MSERARQLVRNKQEQSDCMVRARRLQVTIINTVGCGCADPESLAELDCPTVSNALRQLQECKTQMRELRKEYNELAGMASGD